ncbi:hypothetical protein P7C73_g5676, partial [Tremellales sp. Uapishka_1]
MQAEVEYHPSLDLAVDDNHESHYIGPNSFSDYTMAVGRLESELESMQETTQTPVSSAGLRQISMDAERPAFFVHNPAFIYGKGSVRSESILQGIKTHLGPVQMDDLLETFLNRTLPAFPVLNRVRLEAAINKQPEAGPFPHALLAGISGHALVYYPIVRRQHFQQIWGQVSLALDVEYRQPKLQTLQLALIDLGTRPNDAHGQNYISLSRVSRSFIPEADA